MAEEGQPGIHFHIQVSVWGTQKEKQDTVTPYPLFFQNSSVLSPILSSLKMIHNLVGLCEQKKKYVFRDMYKHQ